MAGVVGVDPREAVGVVVLPPQGGQLDVAPVEVADHGLHPEVAGLGEQVPVELARLGPLRGLRELGAHEDQLLAGVGPHVGQVGAEVGQLLPGVAGHLVRQRALAVHDLVMAQRQHVVLGVGIDEGEGQLAVVVGAVDGIPLEVTQRVVHPPHVPLEAETEPAARGRPRHTRPRRGLLGDRHDAGHPLVDGGVELLEELHRFQVLVAAVLVGLPLARVAGVVEVEHRGDAVDAQPVGVELLEPVERVGEQEVADLAPGRSRRCASPTRDASRAAGRGARRAVCRRTEPAPTRRSRSAREPSRGSRRRRPGGGRRRAGGSRRDRRTARPARSTT